MRARPPRDSFTALREQTRWRIAMVLCLFGMTMMIVLGVLNARSGRTDSVWLAVAVFVVLAAGMAAMLMLPRSLGGQIYFWMTVAVLVYLPYFGWQQGRTFHYWAYVLPPVLFFVVRPGPALVGMVAFGLYAGAMILPFTPPIDVFRFELSYLLLVGFMYTYAVLDQSAVAILRHHSDHDALTNCLNRRTFNETLQQFEQAPPQEDCALLLIDIDHFKSINDRLGHLVGDRVITQVAARLGQQLEADAGLYRYGGEEFAVILLRCDEAAAVALGERLRAAVAAAPIAETRVSVSVGVAQWHPTQATLTATIEAADRALYAAKRSGRDRVVAASSLPREVASA